MIDAMLKELCGQAAATSPTQYLIDLMAKALLQPLGPGSAPPVLQRIFNLQRAALDVEALWPRISEKAHRMPYRIYKTPSVDVMATVASLPTATPLYCHSPVHMMHRGRQVLLPGQ